MQTTHHTPQEQVIVSIHCLVYNHEAYIKKCLEGFVMQKTNFLFEAIVHDDASTDKSADIIREYAEKFPHIIKPIYQTENQYSQKNGAIGQAIAAKTRGKYIALCEGDDCWVDPFKLQKQVDFLEAHPDYSLACTDAIVQNGEKELNWLRYSESCEIPFHDVVGKRGAWIYTASMLYRRTAMDDYPDFAKQCHIGDYPTTIHLAMKGKVYFFAEKMVTYHYMHAGSWSASTRINEDFYPNWLSEARMLQGFKALCKEKHEKLFQRILGKYAIYYLRHAPTMKKKVLEALPDFPKWLEFSDKLKWWRLRLGLNGIKRKILKHIKQR